MKNGQRYNLKKKNPQIIFWYKMINGKYMQNEID